MTIPVCKVERVCFICKDKECLEDYLYKIIRNLASKLVLKAHLVISSEHGDFQAHSFFC